MGTCLKASHKYLNSDIKKKILTFKFWFLYINITIYANVIKYNIHSSLILVYKRGEKISI